MCARAHWTQRPEGEVVEAAIQRRTLAGEELEITRAQGADLLNLTPDADVRTFRDRLEGWRSDAELTGRPAALGVLGALEEAHPEWFGGQS